MYHFKSPFNPGESCEDISKISCIRPAFYFIINGPSRVYISWDDLLLSAMN